MLSPSTTITTLQSSSKVQIQDRKADNRRSLDRKPETVITSMHERGGIVGYDKKQLIYGMKHI